MDFRSKLQSGRIYVDGALGTMLQSAGMQAGELPELWNISKPEVIREIHYRYLCAGADVLTMNTFGANRLKYDAGELEEIISCAVQNARAAIKQYEAPDKYVALDIGPTGRLLKPLGDLEFEEAVSIFKETVLLGEKYGADLILIETMNDSYETKAAVLAAKENSTLPICVTNAYDESGQLMTGATPSAMVAMLEGMRVDALGVNCSFGPDKMIPVVKELLEYASIPVIVSPNAGLPVWKDGKTTYDLSPEQFACGMTAFANMGASILGGCCGTTPEHIKAMVEATRSVAPKAKENKGLTVISSYAHTAVFGEKPLLIGERINPTGKPLLKNALRENDFDYILREGISQQELGADVLDVNVGLPEIDEPEVLTRAICQLQTVTDLPLQIDTSNAEAMERAMRVYNGKPLVNSVNGKKESMETIFPLVQKYGGVVIALTLDETGIPDTADGRIAIAEKMIRKAKEYGIEKHDIVVDPLAMTVSTDPKSSLVTLECVRRLTAMGIKTSLGVSNVSFGLPGRGIVNSTFFTMAMHSGLSAAIMNPFSKNMMEAYIGYCALTDQDQDFEKLISYASQTKTESTEKQTTELTLKEAVVKGLKEEAAEISKQLLEDCKPLEVIDAHIIPALNEIGYRFENKTAFLPQLLMAAEAAKAAFEVMKQKMEKGGEKREKKCKVILATVKGDIHDIGKNIVKTLLENYDFDVIDLGKDVAPELIVRTAMEQQAPLVGLSALMTTTVPAMADTISLLKEKLPNCRVAVGGAVLTQEYADMIHADKYCADAMETVRYAEKVNAV